MSSDEASREDYTHMNKKLLTLSVLVPLVPLERRGQISLLSYTLAVHKSLRRKSLVKENLAAWIL